MKNLHGIPHGKYGYCWPQLYKRFLGQLLKANMTKCAEDLGFTLGACGLIQQAGYHGHFKSHSPNASNLNEPLKFDHMGTTKY